MMPDPAATDDACRELMRKNARESINQNLKKNREAAAVYQEMLPEIRAFSAYANVHPFVFKCMDGRTQTNDHKGIPPTVATNRRSQGGRTDLTRGNLDVWDAIEKERLRTVGDGASQLFIFAGHESTLSTGCAAFLQEEDALQQGSTEEAGKEYMHRQALIMRHEFSKDSSIDQSKIAILSAMTNTDTGSMKFYNNRKFMFDADSIIADKGIDEPSEVFTTKFVRTAITEEWAHASIREKTPESILNGEYAAFFTDMRVKIAFEAYMMRMIAETGHTMIRPDIVRMLQKEFDNDLNEDVQTFLTYIMTMNLAYGTHYRKLIDRWKNSDPNALKARISHGELKMAYSISGHDLEDRNSFLLIKKGSGNEEEAVGIGLNVLTHNLEDLHLRETLPPIAHVNVELTKPIETWDDYVDVVGRMRAKVGVIEKVFNKKFSKASAADLCIFTTYSYHQSVPISDTGVPRTKQFMPLNANPKNARILISEAEDIGANITKQSFSAVELHKRERAYTNMGTTTVLAG